jgi:hypothetical protein
LFLWLPKHDVEDHLLQLARSIQDFQRAKNFPIGSNHQVERLHRAKIIAAIITTNPTATSLLLPSDFVVVGAPEPVPEAVPLGAVDPVLVAVPLVVPFASALAGTAKVVLHNPSYILPKAKFGPVWFA